MAYFDEDLKKFFKELTKNNHKAWFDENRSRYEQVVKKPFKNFITDLVTAIQSFDPYIQIEAKQAIFRINRDVRFSKDKQPYKTNVSAVLSRFNKKEEFPCYYISLDAEKMMIGGGLYFLSPENLFKVRQEILYNEEHFKKVINQTAFRNEFGDIQGKKNKILKPPFKETVESLPILLNKQYYFMKSHPVEIAFREDLVGFVSDKMKKASKVNAFMRLALEIE